MRSRSGSSLVVPTAEEVLQTLTDGGAGAETDNLVSTPNTYSVPDIPADLAGIVLTRRQKVQVSAFVDEPLYEYSQVVGMGVFVEGAVKHAINSWQEVLNAIVPYEDSRKAARKAGINTCTISGRIDRQLHQRLQVVAAKAKVIPGFKLSRFMAAAMSVYAIKLRSNHA
jgi:hypothetical protein